MKTSHPNLSKFQSIELNHGFFWTILRLFANAEINHTRGTPENVRRKAMEE